VLLGCSPSIIGDGSVIGLMDNTIMNNTTVFNSQNTSNLFFIIRCFNSIDLSHRLVLALCAFVNTLFREA
jgi:hypothetical protein